MKKIFLRNGLYLKEHVIQLVFPYDAELKEIVKSLTDCRWDVAQKVWYVPYTEKQVDALLKALRGKAWLDYSQLKKVALPKPAPQLPELEDLDAEQQKKWQPLWTGCATSGMLNPPSRPIRAPLPPFSGF
ncbi:hypothetical protein [Litoribacter populi]|uniref:hypothetical protein n=1 Tax=Litoribacter populi TaxID=2598460 RepID=UPI00117E1414|nr:hypothetical protein [Litoribacter populi]